MAGTALYNSFYEFGKVERDETAIYLYDAPAECGEDYNAQDESLMMYRRDFKDKKTVNYKGSTRLTEIETWSKTHLVPSYFEFDYVHNDLILA